MHLTRISRLGAAAAATVLAGSLAVALPSAVGAAEPPALLTGLITDAATGQPVPGACVDLEHPTYLTLVARACAGSDGQYTVPGKAASANMNVLTRAYADGYLDAWAVRRERYQSPVAVLKASGAAVRNFKLGREAGELRGTFVDREGGPMGLVSIFIYLESATTVSPVAATRTAPDGTWSVRTVPPGSYRIETDRGASVMGAGPFVVTAGGSTVADVSSSSSGQFSPSKELNGTVRDTGGESVPGARVALWYPGYGEHVSVLTDTAGAYRFPRVTSSFLDSYKIVVTAPGYGATWSGDRPHPESALRVQNLPTTNDFTLRKDAGTVSGRLVDGAGEPVVTTVQLRQSNGWLHTAYTMADGTYRFPNVRPDEVTLNYATTGPKQWAARKLSEAEADRYPVAAGATVTVDNQLYGPTGTLEVRLVDADTGELLPKACARM